MFFGFYKIPHSSYWFYHIPRLWFIGITTSHTMSYPHEDSLMLTPANDLTEGVWDMQLSDADAFFLPLNEIQLFDAHIWSEGLPWTKLFDETIKFKLPITVSESIRSKAPKK